MARNLCRSILTHALCQLFVILFVLGSTSNAASIRQSGSESTDLCDSRIYCKGDLLKTVQLAKIFADSKTFVDHYQLNDPAVTLGNFEKLMAETNGKPTRVQVQKYVEDNFASQNELVDWKPEDWSKSPEFVESIKDPKYRDWVMELNDIWLLLSKKIGPSVVANPERHSLITLENGFIVPGGRFQESYYWDSYWVIEGLLLTGMHSTAKGIIENFLSMVKRFGFIPNGCRIYYLMRSQPPLLIPMVERYVTTTGDLDFLRENLPLLEKEFAFFQREKTVDVFKGEKTYRMARYVVDSEGPRPESYKEDYGLAEHLSSEADRKILYDDLKAGAESGWDFSSRWFISPGGGQGNLSEISTKNIIPVDLNAFMQRNARYLAEFNELFQKPARAKYYHEIAREYQRGIDGVLWNANEGIWLDYDIENSRSRNYFYISNIAPLYTNSFDGDKAEIYANKTVDYLIRNGIEDYMGGIPTSLSQTSEQWDFPNAWPPLQSMMVQGLRNTGQNRALKLAEELADRWLRANYLGFKETGKMFEKYDATNPGKSGGGGEYIPQEGFGWTNGVVLEFLNAYPQASPDKQLNEEVES